MMGMREAFHPDVKRLVAMMPAAVRFSAIFDR
jgi:hypothetical protein